MLKLALPALLLLAAACGGKTDKPGAATTPAPAVEPVAVAAPTKARPTVVDGKELAENQRFGRLLSVGVDESYEACFVTVLIPGRDGGSIFDGRDTVCEEDHSADIDQDVVISLDGDLAVTSIVPWSEYY